MLPSETIVCRCEEVTLEQLELAFCSDLDTSRQIKMKTRATMGACQGRVCRRLVEAWMESKVPGAGESLAGFEHLSVRPPVRPVTFGMLAKGESL